MKDVFVAYTITLELLITLAKLDLISGTIDRSGMVDISEFARKICLLRE